MRSKTSLKVTGSTKNNPMAWETTFAIAFWPTSTRLVFYAGIHEMAYGYHRMLGKTFPFTETAK